MSLTLTDAQLRRSDAFPITPSISSDGSRVFLVYQIDFQESDQPQVIPVRRGEPVNGRPDETNVAAELFDVESGLLLSVRTLPLDLDYGFVGDGHANASFDTFSIVDDNGDDIVRLRLLDGKFRLRGELICDDLITSDSQDGLPCSPGGGTFSPDGRLVAFSYLSRGEVDRQKTTLRVVDVDGVALRASAEVDGGSDGPRLFRQGDVDHVLIATHGGRYEFGFENSHARHFARVTILRLEGDRLVEITRVELAQAVLGVPSVRNVDGVTWIGVGTARAVPAGAVTVFTDDSDRRPFTDDLPNFRLYRFNDDKLSLVTSQAWEGSISTPTFLADHTLAVAIQGVDSDAGLLQLHRLKRGCSKCNKCSRLQLDGPPRLIPPLHSAAGSQDGSWLIVTGSDENDRYRNVLLYRVEL